MTKIAQKQNRRILLRPDIMEEAVKRHKLSVPIAAILRDLELLISRPTLDNLIHNWLRLSVNRSRVFDPGWLLSKEEGGNEIQVQPKNYYYIGRFPYGEWKLKVDLLSTPKGNNAFQDLFKDK